jgi:hypothetical protein
MCPETRTSDGISRAHSTRSTSVRTVRSGFRTLAALCEVLECQPGDLLRWEAEPARVKAPLGSPGGFVTAPPPPQPGHHDAF